jgi:hypothetical protein
MKIYFKMKKFIVIQMQIDNEIIEGNNKNICMSNVVRQIEAESKEIAIGKFVIATQDIKAQKKMNIRCYDLSELLRVD